MEMDNVNDDASRGAGGWQGKVAVLLVVSRARQHLFDVCDALGLR
jgi:hypothetical protein